MADPMSIIQRQQEINQAQEAGNMRNALTAQTLAEHFHNLERQKAYEGEVGGLGSGALPQQYIDVASKFGKVGDVLHWQSQRQIAQERVQQQMANLQQQQILGWAKLAEVKDENVRKQLERQFTQAMSRRKQELAEYAQKVHGIQINYQTGEDLPGMDFSQGMPQSAASVPGMPQGAPGGPQPQQGGVPSTAPEPPAPGGPEKVVLPPGVSPTDRTNLQGDFGGVRVNMKGATPQQLLSGAADVGNPELTQAARLAVGFPNPAAGGTQPQGPATPPAAAPSPVPSSPATQAAPQVAGPGARPMPPEIQSQYDAEKSPVRKAMIRQAWVNALARNQSQEDLTPEAVKVAGWRHLLVGQSGMSSWGTAHQRIQAANEAARIGTQLGLSASEMAMLPTSNKAKEKALREMTNWASQVGMRADKLERDLQVAIQYAEKLPLGKLQLLNKAILAGETEFNDPMANAYSGALNSVRAEYSRLMSGPTSNAMLPVEAMKKGNEYVNRGVDVPALKEIGRQMQMDANNTKVAAAKQIQELSESFIPGDKSGSNVLVPPKSGPAGNREEIFKKYGIRTR